MKSIFVRTFRNFYKRGTSDMSIGVIIASIIAVVIAISMIPLLTGSIDASIGDNRSAGENVSASTIILLGLITLIFVAGILVLIVKKFIK